MRSSREEKADGDGVDVGGNDDDEEKKLLLTLRLRVELAYEPDLPEKLNFQQSCRLLHSIPSDIYLYVMLSYMLTK